MKVLVFCGAGVSAELGVPAMRPMAEQFLQHLRDAEVPVAMVNLIQQLLVSRNNDMEHAIDIVDKLVNGEQTKKMLGLPNDPGFLAFALIREEAEWFVQHACEQIDSRRAFHIWSQVISAAQSHQLLVATTNYDRALEITATRLKIPFVDGFEAFNGREFAPWRGFSEVNGLHILKLHGSTDWYHGKHDEVFKLRHPMPLFGALEVNSAEGVTNLRSALVLPSREKITTMPPFPALQARFRNELLGGEAAFFVGSSLRDPHLRDICAECAKQMDTYIVSRDGIQPENIPTGAKQIIQTSGHFLISTLPAFLRNSGNLMQDTEVRRVGPTVLDDIVVAADGALTALERCTAIENLSERNISLGKELIGDLLQSSSSDVKLNALGLIKASYDQEDVLKLATGLAADNDDPPFIDELDLLYKTLEISKELQA